MQSNLLFPQKKRFPELENDAKADVVIVGGGMVGVSSAYHLQQAGYEVIVIEQDEVGSCASGASSAILYYGSGTNFLDATDLFGKEKAEVLWKESSQTMKVVEELVVKNALELEVGFRKPGGIMVSQTEKENEYLEKERENLNGIGIRTEMLSGDDIMNYYTGKKFLKGLYFPECFQIHSAHFCASLAEHFDIKLFEQTPYTKHEQTNNELLVTTPAAKISCNKILLATNLYPLLGFDKYFYRETSIITASTALSDDQLKKTWPRETFIWTMEDDYQLFYPHEGRNIMELYKIDGQKEAIRKFYPGGFEIGRVWGFAWAKAKDWLPMIGKIGDNIFAAVAMGDQGITMSNTTGRKITYLLDGKDDDFLSLCSINRFNENS